VRKFRAPPQPIAAYGSDVLAPGLATVTPLRG
jgi:hypothetical protein